MATVSLKVTDADRVLWVVAAEGEGVSLSEWLRRAAAERVVRGAPAEGSGVAGPSPNPVRSGHTVAPDESGTEEEGFLALPPEVVDPGPGSPSVSDPVASVPELIAQARKALEPREFKGPDFKQVKEKKKR